MLKVFLTEDERLVREGLRDMIPWEKYGFVFAGEASDGEMALPLVRKIKPDVLITDIKMPFMDGLAFSRLISKELPATKIIILSGYDDFAYAQQAIELHVDQYLLKPITRASMIQALEQTKARIEEERDQQDYRRRFIRESQEYEHYARRVFFEQLVGGHVHRFVHCRCNSFVFINCFTVKNCSCRIICRRICLCHNRNTYTHRCDNCCYCKS